MKKVLVTGAAGTIGLQVIKYLLSEGKYEITALDLKNSKNNQKLKKYKNRINVIFGDVCNRVLIEALVKDFDIIIHLAGVMMPLADLKKDLADCIDYVGCENIVRAICYYNPKCHLFYASSMLLYKNKKEVSVKTSIKLTEDDYYAMAKKKCEDLIKEKLKNYTIYRFPLVLSKVNESLVLNGIKSENVLWISKEDAAYSFVKGLDFKAILNKKTFNVTSDGLLMYRELLSQILKEYGISMKYIYSRLFIDHVSYNYNCLDQDDLDKMIHYRNDTLDNYYKRLKTSGKNRKIRKLIGKYLVKGNII